MAAEPNVSVTPRMSSAAVMIQKTYRGYRARRKLADAAIMSKSVGWWNVVDAVVLQEQTEQYYAHSKSWKANDNWKRLKCKASKVGKGLEKNNKALKLALQHWLEAVDARHRHGANLRHYYLYWQQLETSEPFFYWLDLGSGRQLELQKCSRATLQEQQIKYLSPEQRRHYEVAVYNGKLFYKMSGELVHTGSYSKSERWIFVMSPSSRIYIGKKERGVFQHSSFLAGGTTTAAGRLVVEHGVVKLIEAHSGHYRPSPENFEILVQILIARGADLHLAKVKLVSDDLVELENGKQLAGEVRAGIEQAGAEGHFGVKIAKQEIVTVDSSIDDGSASDRYLVTNLTFPECNGTMAKNQEDEDSAAKNEADRVNKEQPTNNEATVPEQPAEGLLKPAPVAQEDEHQQPASLEKPPTSEEPLNFEKKPCPLVLPIPMYDNVNPLNPNLPKTVPTVPTSSGFTRNASLAVLGPQELRQTLEKVCA